MRGPLPELAGSAGLGGTRSLSGALPFRMVPRTLVLSATTPANGAAAGDYRRSGGRGPERIVLEYDETSGLFTPAWFAVRPEEARGRWRLQVAPQFEDVLGFLVHRGVPLVWLTTHWDWVGNNVLAPVSPRDLVDLLRLVEIRPA